VGPEFESPALDDELVLSMVAGFLLVESGLWLGGRFMRSHVEAAGVREEL
jgi:hypothetical protein